MWICLSRTLFGTRCHARQVSWLQEACRQERALECWVGVKDISEVEGNVGKRFSGAAFFLMGGHGCGRKAHEQRDWGGEVSGVGPEGWDWQQQARRSGGRRMGEALPHAGSRAAVCRFAWSRGPTVAPHSIPPLMCFSDLHRDYLKPEKLCRDTSISGFS